MSTLTADEIVKANFEWHEFFEVEQQSLVAGVSEEELSTFSGHASILWYEEKRARNDPICFGA